MSLTKEDLQAIKAIIKEETDPIKNDICALRKDVAEIKAEITDIKADIEDIKEYAEITRVSANESTAWLRKWSGKDKPFPVDDEEFEEEDIM